jgi:hypothetical protein
METMGIIIIVVLIRGVFGIVTALIASAKGRNVPGWFFGGFFIDIIAIIIVACLSNLKEEKSRWQSNEMQQRRIREQLRRERLKNEALRQYSMQRLDAHDQILGVDTRSGMALPGGDPFYAGRALPAGTTVSLPGADPAQSINDPATPISRLQAALETGPAQPLDPNDPATWQQAAQPPVAVGLPPMSPAEIALRAMSSGNGRAPAGPFHSSRQWFYELAGKAQGPTAEGELRDMLRGKEIAPETLVWTEGMTEWMPARDLADLTGEAVG